MDCLHREQEGRSCCEKAITLLAFHCFGRSIQYGHVLAPTICHLITMLRAAACRDVLGLLGKDRVHGTPSPPPATSAAPTEGKPVESVPSNTAEPATATVPPLEAGPAAKSTAAPVTPEGVAPAPAVFPATAAAADDRYATSPGSKVNESPAMPAVPPTSSNPPPPAAAAAEVSGRPKRSRRHQVQACRRLLVAPFSKRLRCPPHRQRNLQKHSR